MAAHDSLFPFGYRDFADHTVSAETCDECWSSYPRPCTCGGRIHAVFGDENYDGDYWLDYLCERCGKDYDEVEAG